MSGKYLIVVDMQNDFINGALGSREAEAIVSNVVKKVNAFDGTVIFTQDTHFVDYLSTQEGRMLPVEHCILDNHGWLLVDELQSFQQETGARIYQKHSFGSVELAQDLQQINERDSIESIELVGVCTDICVVSNALLLKAFMREVPMSVDAACCAGVTPEKHLAALETLRSCQVTVTE
ncbi:MAG: cysteine hydrolase [Lachnospiraceae bacterium]|nr:cysteine hydrolase [Lachnospiraceae bacterium]